ncbi:unannotated protein [freshwater metagenome]|uniref:Unannotated protein n=1 Tax=freshwater metagenome TaxID=449393 RepID=A0A6J7SDE4_9ZZZZ
MCPPLARVGVASLPGPSDGGGFHVGLPRADSSGSVPTPRLSASVWARFALAPCRDLQDLWNHHYCRALRRPSATRRGYVRDVCSTQAIWQAYRNCSSVSSARHSDWPSWVVGNGLEWRLGLCCVCSGRRCRSMSAEYQTCKLPSCAVGSSSWRSIAVSAGLGHSRWHWISSHDVPTRQAPANQVDSGGTSNTGFVHTPHVDFGNRLIVRGNVP